MRFSFNRHNIFQVSVQFPLKYPAIIILIGNSIEAIEQMVGKAAPAAAPLFAFQTKFCGLDPRISAAWSSAERASKAAFERLADSEWAVVKYYMTIKKYVGAQQRLREILKSYPDYSKRDRTYSTLFEALTRQGKNDEAREGGTRWQEERPGAPEP